MTNHFSAHHALGPASSYAAPRRVLVVDDSRAQRMALRLQLARWGYAVTEAASGDEALALCKINSFDFILSDWVMPEMDGITFCHHFRALNKENYGYFLLLTSKSEKGEIAKGLESGADDYLTKPVTADELRARLRAGERILTMQEELRDKNVLVSSTLEKLQTVYDSLDRDLIEARKLQLALVRDRQRDYGSALVSLTLRPSGHVGGDLVGSFPIDDTRFAAFAVDVSGHGVASAMMTARIAGLFSGADADLTTWSPCQVASELNGLLLDEWKVDQYFTMVYAEIDTETGEGKLVQAGHPHPYVLRQTGRIEALGEGGLPIGLIPNAQFEEVSFALGSGDRLIVVSDGVTECANAEGVELGPEGLAHLLQKNFTMAGLDLLEALVWDVQTYRGNGEFGDDVSALVVDFKPRPAP